MPNLMLYGYTEQDGRDLRGRIEPVLRDLGHADDGVTTIVFSEARFCDGRREGPYLRICSTTEEELQRIHIALRAAGVNEDSEFLVLLDFKEKTPTA